MVDVILVGVDGTPESRAAVAWAAALAGDVQARVVAVHVVATTWEWEMAAMQIDTEPLVETRRLELAGRWTEPLRVAGVDHTTRLLEGDPAKQLRRAAFESRADLIVVGGARAGRLHDLLFGHVRHQLVTSAPCPVVVVPEPDPSAADTSAWKSAEAR